ncbi:MAG: TIGR00341 family protein, partial [Planctomycetota bacterium]
DDGVRHFRILTRSEDTETVSDALTKRLSGDPGFRSLVFDVRATMPVPEEREEEEAAEETAAAQEEGEKKRRPDRISRDELRVNINAGLRSPRIYALFVLFSAVVACAGLLYGDAALLIGAMVIAPLLVPNMALSLATALGDGAMLRKALVFMAIGVSIVLGLSILTGVVFDVDTTQAEIVTRTHVGIGSVLVALAAGAAGTLSLTSGAPSALIGVMVAVALLPPLATAGLLFGNGDPKRAGFAAMLAFTNIVCINLAGLATYALQGVSPLWFWEVRRSRHWITVAMITWLGLLAAIVVVILVLGP